MGELSPHQHPGQVVVKRQQQLLQFKLTKSIEQLWPSRDEQPDLEPSPLQLQPTRLPKLLLLILHSCLQPLLQPLLQLLQDDRAVGLHQEEENVLLEQCLEHDGQTQVNSTKNYCRYIFVTFFMNIHD